VTTWRDAKSGRPVPILRHEQKLAALVPADREAPAPNVGRLLRGLVVGAQADDAAELAEERKALGVVPDPSGGYTVPGALASWWIDALRAEMVLSRAGATTVPMTTNSLDIARLVSDPTVSWHGENDALSDADPTFGRVSLQSKTVVALVRMSLELAQDSANIDAVLQRALTQALAHAIDSAGMVGTTVDAALAPTGLFNLAGRNTVTSIGAPTSWDFLVDGAYELMADNAPAPTALIGHPAIWKKMAKLKTGLSSDNTSLPMNPAVAGIPRYFTTAAPLAGGTTAKAVVGHFPDLLFGVRQQITVRVLREAFLGSNLQVGVLAYARCDFVAAREESFCTLEGITV
jgi:HK97 family phage major capsid protein